MTDKIENASGLCRAERKRGVRLLIMCLIFLSGLIVGAVSSRIVTRSQMIAMLKNPEKIPDRILPRLKSSLKLTEPQYEAISLIVREHHREMEELRAQSYPGLLLEFKDMRNEVAEHLSPEQKKTWESLASMVEGSYLPSPPKIVPSAT